jgi:hypothetical protein
MKSFAERLLDLELSLWFVVYDESATRSYAFADFESVLRSIEGSIKTYHGDDDTNVEIAVELMLEDLRRLSHAPCVPVKYKNLKIAIFRFPLDRTHPVVKLLEKCHRQTTNRQLKLEIESFFYDKEN